MMTHHWVSEPTKKQTPARRLLLFFICSVDGHFNHHRSHNNAERAGQQLLETHNVLGLLFCFI